MLKKRQRALAAIPTAAAILGTIAFSVPAEAVPPAQATKATSLTACGGQAYAPPGGGWGPEALGNCGVFGSPGRRLGLRWSTNIGSMAQVCVQAYSYQDKKWYNVGCGASGGGTIPWGNVAATPKVRAASNGLGTGLTWSY